jgi:hypothetical protein
MGGAMREGELSALGVLYQGEKADATGILNVAMAMMGIGAAYIVGAVGFVDEFGSSSFPWLAVLLVPLPLWLIAAFHSLLTLNGMMHGVSVQILEDRLCREARIEGETRRYVGSKGGDQIMDVRKAKAAHRMATYFVYGGVAGAVVGFTAFVLTSVWQHLPLWVMVVAFIVYVGAFLIVGWSWAKGLGLVGRAEGQRDSMEPKSDPIRDVAVPGLD